MISRIGLVLNPSAGHGRAARHEHAIREGLHTAGYEVRTLSGANYQTALHHTRGALAAGLDAIVVAGGDGMVHLGANALAGTQVPLGIVAIGSGNDIAAALGLPIHDIGASLRQLTAALEAGPAGMSDIDTVAVSRPGEPTAHWYVSSLCCGLDAAIATTAMGMSWPRGGGRYIRATLSELARFSAYGYAITADGERWQQRATLVTVSNTALFGGGMRIAPHARPDDGELNLVVADDLPRRRLARLFPRLYSGSHVTDPAVRVRRVGSVRIEPVALSRPLPPPIADGELMTPLPLQCDVHPRALRVLGPTLET